MTKESQFSEAEIERFERIRIFEIDKLKKEIEEHEKELETEKTKFFKSGKKISQIENAIKEKKETLMKLEHQTGYDLLVESKKSGISKFMENLNCQNIGSAVEIVGNVIPVFGVSGIVKSIGKNIQKIGKK